MSPKPLFLLFIVFTSVFFACQRDLTPPDAADLKCRVAKVIQGTHNGLADDSTLTFHYNDTGRLLKINLRTFDFEDDFTMDYDNQNRLIKVTGFLETGFGYNDKGLLSEVKYVPFSDSSKIVFTYGNDDLPVGSKRYDKMNGQWEQGIENRYTFQNGNMVMKEVFMNGISKWKEYFEYHTNIPNELKLYSLLSLNSVPLGLFEEFLFFNKNLLKKATREQDGYYVDYKLDSGRVAQSTHTWLTMPGNDSGTRETRFYHYECK